MSTVRRRNNKWQAQVRKKGALPISKTFTKRSDALSWAKVVEADIERGLWFDRAAVKRTTVSEVLDRYAREIIPTLRSEPQELARARYLKNHLGNLRLTAVTSAVLAEYRDRRLQVLAPQSVKHELGLLNRTLKCAHQEWGLRLPHGVPKVRHPRLPKGRERRLEGDEELRLLDSLSHIPAMRAAVRFALETAMRRGELAAMKWQYVDLRRCLVTIPETKTGTPRTIPLSSTAVQTLKTLPRLLGGAVFGVQPDSITQAFSRACKRTGIEDLRFHDLRHEAVSRLFERGLNVMEVATISGHQDLKMLNRYTHLRPEDLLKKLG